MLGYTRYFIRFFYGIEVAAMTNSVGMLIELGFYAVYFARKKGTLRIKKPIFNFADIKRILSNGFATFLMEFSLPAITFSFNLVIIKAEGTLGVAAYSIVGYVCSVMNMVLIGVTQGAQPLMSLYHGKGETELFSYTYLLGIRTNIIIPVILTALYFVFSDGIVSLFHSGNPELTTLTTRMVRQYPLAYIAIGATLMNILFFQTTERNIFSAAISALCCIGYIQVFLLISVYIFNYKVLYLTFFFGELCHLVISQILVRQTKRMESKDIQTIAKTV
ncbi:MAG: MATE family efflux transporter [Acholeplasmataceae bacterium]|nr:MATE family efflux transporter [Acholeplasmataceae bacterium]